MSALTVTFEPLKRYKDLTTLSYLVDTEEEIHARQEAERLLLHEGYHRSHFKKQVRISKQVETVKPTSENTIAGVDSADESDLTSDDNTPTEPTTQERIDELNARLAKLKRGERLIVSDLPDDIYHGCEAISSSMLKTFLDCPTKYKAKFIDKIIEPKEQDYYNFGKAAHCILLEPDEYDFRFIRQPDEITNRNSNAWKDFKKESDRNGQIVLNKKQFEDIPLLKAQVMNHPYAHRFTTGGITEQSIFVRDMETGLVISARPDHQHTLQGQPFICDLKTSKSVKYDLFHQQAANLHYDLSAAMYAHISEVSHFVLVAIESTRPFEIGVFMAPNEFLRLGYLKYRKALKELKQAIDSDTWHGYQLKPAFLELKGFQRNALDELEAVSQDDDLFVSDESEGAA